MNGQQTRRATYAIVAAVLIFVATTSFWFGQQAGKMADANQPPKPAIEVELPQKLPHPEIPMVLEGEVAPMPDSQPNEYGFLLFAPEIEAAMLGEAHSRSMGPSRIVRPRMNSKTEFAPSAPKLLVEPVK